MPRRAVRSLDLPRRARLALGVALLASAVAACGSAGGKAGTAAGTSSTTLIALGSSSGVGLTEPTAPAGTKMSGGTVYFTEASDATPNYIFPMYNPQVCSLTNYNELIAMMYRPLYWYGNDERPTVDYDKSLGRAPMVSDHGTTVTLKLNAYKWSDGENVTSRDLVFWMNVLRASPATEWCGTVAGLFPYNVTSYSAPDADTFVMHFNKPYNPEWLLYNELSQLTPLPLAWDRTSLSQPAPKADNGHLPDATKAGARAVYNFLNAQSDDLGRWTSSPLWHVVDGPFRLQSFTSNGEATLVPNPDYSGSPKPSISKFVELPFTSEAAIYNEIRSGGPSTITIGSVPSQYAPEMPALESEGYMDDKAASYAINYFPLNFNSNATTSPGGEPIRYVFRQLYFRQAFQHLVDQPGWTNAFLNNTAIPTYSPIPLSPPGPVVSSSGVAANPYPFSVSAASALLTANGWEVVPGGVSTCVKPGASVGECGLGIAKGEGISFNLDYLSGVVSVEDEMNDLASDAKKLGISIVLTTHPLNTVIGHAVACQPAQGACNWTAQNFGAGWVYGPDNLPTGEMLFDPGSVANYGSYSDPKATQLIAGTITGPKSGEAQAMLKYARYVATSLPVVWGPTQIGTYGAYAGTLIAKDLGGYAANALGFLTPEDWYFTR